MSPWAQEVLLCGFSHMAEEDELAHFCDTLCNELSQQSAKADEAERVRSSSSDTEDSCHLFCEYETWWSRLLKSHTEGLPQKSQSQTKRCRTEGSDLRNVFPVKIVSGCSGLLPEASVFQAGWVKLRTNVES